MGRAEERRARQAQQRGGRRAASRASMGSAGPGPIRRLFTWKKILGTFFGLCLVGIGAFIVLYMVIDVPEGNADAKRQGNLYKYSDGTTMARAGYNREIVDLSQVPKDVQRSFVAAENKSFYKDNGIDLKGTARGLLNTLSGKGKQGGSTITQQYVKNYYLSQDQTVTRKLKELVISLKVDQQKSKDDILAGYINTSYYGRGAYGIQAAAQAYYRVDAKDLTLEQGAYLASLLQAPNQYDWAIASDTGKKLAKARWNYTLDNMVDMHWLNSGERARMKFAVPKEPKAAPGMTGQTGYLVQLANQELAQQIADQQGISEKDAGALVENQGWTITLNISKAKQKQLENSVKAQLTSKLDAKKRAVDGDVQAGAVSVDPKTGKIVALYGGQDYTQHYTSNATRTDYQPASTFKPLIFASALENGAKTQDGDPIDADAVYDGTNKRPVKGSDIPFAPENEDQHDYGDVTVQTAMNKSINSVFAQMGVDVGMDKVVKTATDMGMEKFDAVPAMTLGSMGASPLDMAGIYATFDNHGKKVTPTILKSAKSSTSEVEGRDPIGDQVISREAADTVTSVLTGVVDDGTAQGSVANNPARNGQQVAGKTGTSDCNLSAWFTGYTPDLVTSVGMFGEAGADGGTSCPDKKPVKAGAHVSMGGAMGGGRVNGGGPPAQIWAGYTFATTDGTARFDLDTTTGRAASPTPQPTTPEPSQEPSEQPTTPEPSEQPTTQEPTEEPTTEEPSQEPTTVEPPEPTNSPSDVLPQPTDPAQTNGSGAGRFGNQGNSLVP